MIFYCYVCFHLPPKMNITEGMLFSDLNGNADCENEFMCTRIISASNKIRAAIICKTRMLSLVSPLQKLILLERSKFLPLSHLSPFSGKCNSQNVLLLVQHFLRTRSHFPWQKEKHGKKRIPNFRKLTHSSTQNMSIMLHTLKVDVYIIYVLCNWWHLILFSNMC